MLALLYKTETADNSTNFPIDTIFLAFDTSEIFYSLLPQW